MKYALLVGDGMADKPIAALNGKTPLEYATTPHMDTIARQGCVGLVETIPQGFAPGSDVANMSLMGYDPKEYYSGRAPIEAASLGVALSANDTAFRCNLVNLTEGVMADYSAGHIETDDAVLIIKELQDTLNSDTMRFYPGISYRHLLVISDFPEGILTCTPPHDISDRSYAEFIPHGAGSDILKELSERAHEILLHSPINKKRTAAGKTEVSDIWLWGQGGAVVFPTLHQRYSLTGSVISAVDLVKGLGKLAGLSVRNVEGATGYLGTNYAGKVGAAAQALEKEDFVFLHVEAPDETSHEGIAEKKIQAIEEFDAQIVGEMVKLQEQVPELRLMVLPDHGTLLSTKTHHAMPVPFTACGSEIGADSAVTYSEESAHTSSTLLYNGVTLFDTFITGTF